MLGRLKVIENVCRIFVYQPELIFLQSFNLDCEKVLMPIKKPVGFSILIIPSLRGR